MSTKRSKLTAIFLPTARDVEQISAIAADLNKLSNAELIETYNDSARCGIYGARGQHQRLVALGKVLQSRFGDPIVSYEKGLLALPCTVEVQPDQSLKKLFFDDPQDPDT